MARTLLLSFPTELLVAILIELPRASLCSVARTCRRLNELACCALFRRTDIFFSGNHDDKVLDTLDRLSVAPKTILSQIREIRLFGHWFALFSDLESELGRSYKISPAVRLLNTALAQIVSRTKGLQSFSWDLQVAPTQVLVKALATAPGLKHLTLRLSTDHTFEPFYFPPVEIDGFKMLTSLSLLAIDDPSVLEDLSKILQSTRISSLVVTAGNQLMGSSPKAMLSHVREGGEKLALKALDIRGFDVVSLPWLYTKIEPHVLHELTTQLPENSRIPHDRVAHEYWSSILLPESRLRYLCTDMVCRPLIDCMGSDPYGGHLRTLFLMPCDAALQKYESLIPDFIDSSLPRIGDNLRTLALYSMYGNTRHFTCDRTQLEMIALRCPNLQEFAFIPYNNNLDIVLSLLPNFSHLECLHLVPVPGGPKLHENVVLTPLIRTLEKHPAHRLKLFGLGFDQLFEIVKKHGRTMVEKQSLNFWEDTSKSQLFSQKLTEW